MILNKYDEKTVAEIAACYRRILELVGEDPSREGLIKTPMRAAKAIMDITRGYREDPESIVRSAIFEYSGSQVVTVKDIEFYSVCEHHILPFFGRVSIGYIPDGHIVGLSKLARVVDVYAHRLPPQDDGHIAPCMRDADERGGIGQIRLPRRLIEDFAIPACQFAQQSPHRQPLPPAVRNQETAFGFGHHSRRQEGAQLLMALAHLPDAPQAVNIIMLQQQRHDSLRQGD